MENRRTIKLTTIIKGGALIGALLITTLPVFAYDQKNTHPALTDEIVDFYNLSFPDKKLSQEDKQQLIKGAIDEDSGERPLFHFYDPVYNRGIAYLTSKDWATKNNAQADYYNRQLAGLISVTNTESNADFSYDRAIRDYARGDKKRALFAFGHVLHLLEDAGVPDHTRNDPHPPVLDWGSPYEHEMAKWNPDNFNIARGLWLRREKPSVFNDMGGYFDRIANYSNNNFFSKDTISNKDYSLPKLSLIRKINVGGIDLAFVFNKDKEGKDYPTALIEEKNGTIRLLLFTPEIGSQILDGYWDRLSPEIVKNGAGALRLFLEEAERAKEEYANKPPQKPSFWALLLGTLGIGDTPKESPVGNLTGQASDNIVTTRRVVNVDNNDNPNRLVTRGDNDGVTNTPPLVSPTLSPSPKVSPITTPKPLVSPTVSPTPSPVLKLSTTEKININTANKELLMTLKGIKDAKSDAIILHRQTYGPFQKIEDVMNVNGIGQATFEEIKGIITVGDIVPTPSPAFYASGGGGGGGSSSPTPTPTPTVTPTPTPSPTPSPSPEPELPLLRVSINEIAWMGTATSSNDEWLELYNATNGTIDLSGWTLKATDGTPNVTLSGSISPFGFYLLERTDDMSVSDILADQIYTGDLGNGGEYLELKDTAGNLQDFVDVSTGWPAGENPTGNPSARASMERVNPKQSGNNQANWSTNNGTTKNGHDAAGNPINGTPKSINSGYVALAPSIITDLVATLNSPLTITWSAPEDLDTLPASLSYDLRYSLYDFSDDESIWNTATKVASSSLPSVGEKGASQSASFDVVYEYGQTLYFALKTGLSGISNIAAVSFPTAIDANSWAMLGKDQNHTSFAANITGPAGPTATISWEFPAVAVVSQPVADADGNVYFGASDGTLENSKIYSIKKEGENIVENWQYPTNVSIGTPAVLSDGTVYFGRIGADGSNTFTALNPDGTNKWDYPGTGSVNKVTVSADGNAYFTTNLNPNSRLQVLNSSGELKPGNEKIGPGFYDFSPIVLENGNIIAARRVSGNQFFTAYSSAGAQLWDRAYTDANGSIQSNPSYDQTTGKTYSAVGYDGGSTFARIFVISSDGSSINTSVITPANLGSGATMVAITPTKLLVGLDYTWSDPASGSKLFSLNKSDLSTSWSFHAEGKINPQLAVDQAGNAYFSTQSGHLYSVDPDGNENWRISVWANSTISPILAGNGLIWGFGNRVVLIN